MWQVTTTPAFDEWFTSLSMPEQEELFLKVELLKSVGPRLKRPHADTLKGSRHTNMKELRARTATAVLRVAFAFDPARSAVLLIGGNKAGSNERRFYAALIEQADRLFDRHLAKLKGG